MEAKKLEEFDWYYVDLVGIKENRNARKRKNKKGIDMTCQFWDEALTLSTID